MRRRPTVSRRKGLPLTLPPNAWRKFNDYKNKLKIVSLYYMANRLANPRQKHWTARVMIRWIAKRKPGLLTVLANVIIKNFTARRRSMALSRLSAFVPKSMATSINMVIRLPLCGDLFKPHIMIGIYMRQFAERLNKSTTMLYNLRWTTCNAVARTLSNA
jgi:hypothetical protein